MKIALLALLLSVVACRPPQEETDYSQLEVTAGPVVSEDEVKDALENAKITCEQAASSGRLQQRVEQVVFPATRDCEFNESADDNEFWEINDQLNGPRKNDRIRAAIKQDRSLSLPAGSTLCDIEFDFPTQSMKYDDEILLLLNNYVLFMSTDYSTDSSYSQYQSEGLRINSQGLVEFKWLDENNSANDLYNLDYGHNKAPKFCQGINPNQSDYDDICEIPATETTGQFKLDIPKSDIVTMGALKFDESSSLNDLDFSFVSTGDNDDGDCEHDEFYFNVTVIYSDN